MQGDQRPFLVPRHGQTGELRPGQFVLGLADDALLAKQPEEATATNDRALLPVAVEGVHPGRRLRQRREEGDLGPGEVLDRLVEVATGGVRDAVDAVSIRGKAQVLREDRLAAVAGGEEHAGERLDRLAEVRPPARILHSRHLHRERRRAGHPPAVTDVLKERASHRTRVDARVAPEVPVLEGNGGRDNSLWQCLDRPVPELLAGLRADLGEERAVPVAQEDGGRRRREGRAPYRDRNEGQATQERQAACPRQPPHDASRHLVSGHALTVTASASPRSLLPTRCRGRRRRTSTRPAPAAG